MLHLQPVCNLNFKRTKWIVNQMMDFRDNPVTLQKSEMILTLMRIAAKVKMMKRTTHVPQYHQRNRLSSPQQHKKICSQHHTLRVNKFRISITTLRQMSMIARRSIRMKKKTKYRWSNKNYSQILQVSKSYPALKLSKQLPNLSNRDLRLKSSKKKMMVMMKRKLFLAPIIQCSIQIFL